MANVTKIWTVWMIHVVTETKPYSFGMLIYDFFIHFSLIIFFIYKLVFQPFFCRRYISTVEEVNIYIVCTNMDSGPFLPGIGFACVLIHSCYTRSSFLHISDPIIYYENYVSHRLSLYVTNVMACFLSFTFMNFSFKYIRTVYSTLLIAHTIIPCNI